MARIANLQDALGLHWSRVIPIDTVALLIFLIYAQLITASFLRGFFIWKMFCRFVMRNIEVIFRAYLVT